MTPQDWLQAALLLIGVLSFSLSIGSARIGSPALAVAGRWSRWIFIGVFIGGLVWTAGWNGYPLWVNLSVAFLGWFVIETAYNWVAIQALSRSEMPLFPRFLETDREEWPGQKRYILFKEWLRGQGFKRRQTLMAKIHGHVLLRLSIYQNPAADIRMQLMFLPNHRGNITLCTALHSQSQSGQRLVTDNLFLPFGGFYPDNWRLERKPWTRSVTKLLERHRARMDAFGGPWEPYSEDPLQQINHDQQQIEQLNYRLGFLHPPEEVEESGRITPPGRHRIWIELWTLSYFGKPLRY